VSGDWEVEGIPMSSACIPDSDLNIVGAIQDDFKAKLTICKALCNLR